MIFLQNRFSFLSFCLMSQFYEKVKLQWGIVNDMNLVKRHTKPNPQLGITGGIVEKEMSIHLSNLMIWNGSSNKRDKISFGELKDKKVRLFRSDKKEVKK